MFPVSKLTFHKQYTSIYTFTINRAFAICFGVDYFDRSKPFVTIIKFLESLNILNLKIQRSNFAW